MNTEEYFTKEQKKIIETSIKEAELNTSGEIRVHIEEGVKGEVLDRASYIFKTLGMHKTNLRNGVLFYLALKSKKFAIIGDVGINAKVPEGFWDNIKNVMQGHFTKGEFSEGLSIGIILAGEALRKHFPYQQDDVNELSNEISFGKK